MTRTQRRPPAIWIWSGIIAVVVIVIAVMYWAFNLQPTDDLPSNAREIPALAGVTYEEAVQQLQELGLPAIADRRDERHRAGRPGHPHATRRPARSSTPDTAGHGLRLDRSRDR